MKLRQLAVAFAAVQQVVAPAIIFAGGNFAGFSSSQSLPTPAQPATWAFAIWGPIYLGCLVYAWHQAQPKHTDNPDLKRVAGPSIVLFLLSTAWLYFAKHGPLWATVAIIWPMLAFAVTAMLLLARPTQPLPRATKLAAGWPLAAYAGWLSAAAFVNSAAILPTYGTGTAGLGTQGLGQLMVTIAAALAIVVLITARGALAYALAVVWALVGIMVANRHGPVFWTACAGAVTLVLTALAIRRRRVRPPSPATREREMRA